VDTLRDEYGVGPVCHEPDIAPSSYCRHREYQLHPDRRSHRDQRDEQLEQEIQRVYDENYGVYGVRKVWHQLLREGFSVARCTIARLMKSMNLTGVLRGKKAVQRLSWQRWRGWTGTTIAVCWKGWGISHRQKPNRHIMLPSGIRIWQPEFPTKILSRKTGAVQFAVPLPSHSISP
jgi:hypothetical protein